MEKEVELCLSFSSDALLDKLEKEMDAGMDATRRRGLLVCCCPPLHRRRRKSQTASVLVPISPPSEGEGEQACLLAERWRWMLLRAILLSFASVVRLNAIPCQLATSFLKSSQLRSRV